MNKPKKLMVSSFRNGEVKTAAKSDRWEVFVEIERKGVELLTPIIGLEVLELVPPVLASVLPYLRVLLLQGVVEQECQHACHERLRGEGHVHNVVELPKQPINQSDSVKKTANFFD